MTFLPLRLFAARELRQGRLPSWNPYLFEGSFQLPSLYPADLLHALWPMPVVRLVAADAAPAARGPGRLLAGA